MPPTASPGEVAPCASVPPAGASSNSGTPNEEGTIDRRRRSDNRNLANGCPCCDAFPPAGDEVAEAQHELLDNLLGCDAPPPPPLRAPPLPTAPVEGRRVEGREGSIANDPTEEALHELDNNLRVLLPLQLEEGNLDNEWTDDEATLLHELDNDGRDAITGSDVRR